MQAQRDPTRCPRCGAVEPILNEFRCGSELCPYGPGREALKSPLPDSPASTAIPARSVETRQTEGPTHVELCLELLQHSFDRAMLQAKQGNIAKAVLWVEVSDTLLAEWPTTVSPPTVPRADPD